MDNNLLESTPIYLQPIIADLESKISGLEEGMEEIKTAMAEIPSKIDDQIDELRKVVNAASIGIVSLHTKSGNDEHTLKNKPFAIATSSGTTTADYVLSKFISNSNGMIDLIIDSFLPTGPGDIGYHNGNIYSLGVKDSNGNVVKSVSVSTSPDHRSLNNGVRRDGMPEINNLPVKANELYSIYANINHAGTVTITFDSESRFYAKYDIVNIADSGAIIFEE